MPQPKKKTTAKPKTTLSDGDKQSAITEKVFEPKIKDGLYVDKDGVAKVFAKISRLGPKINNQVVALTKTAAYIIENGKKRELTTKEASAFVRSGWTNPPK